MERQNTTVLVAGATGNMGPYVADKRLSEGTAPEAIIDGVWHLLTNEGTTGQMRQTTGGQPAAAV